MRSTTLAGLSLFALLAAAACNGKSPTQPSTPPPPPAPTVSSVAITGGQTINRPGGAVQLTATATLSDGSTQNVTTSAQWSSSAPGVASVTNGSVTGIGNGDATITATHNGRSGQHQVRVAVPTRANPRVTGNLTVSISPEALFLYRARLELGIEEQDGVWGLNLNFINVQWRDFAGRDMGGVFNYNPGRIAEIWGNNHVNPGQRRTISPLIDYTRAASSVTVQTVVSLGDDLGNPFNFADTFSGIIRLRPTILQSPYDRDPQTVILEPIERTGDDTRP